MNDELPTTKAILRDTPWYGYLLVVISFLAGALLVVVLFGIGSRAQRNSTALTALCALRADLDKRIETSQDFLREHPHGIDGITPTLIRQSLQNSLRTRKTLNILNC